MLCPKILRVLIQSASQPEEVRVISISSFRDYFVMAQFAVKFILLSVSLELEVAISMLIGLHFHSDASLLRVAKCSKAD